MNPAIPSDPPVARRSWRAWVPLAGGAALLLAVLGSLLAVAWYERGLDERYALERSELLAHVLADSATRQVEATALAVATLSELLASGLGPEGPEMRAAMAQTLVNLPFLRGIGVVDSQGRVLGSSAPEEMGLRIRLDALGPWPLEGRDRLGPVVPARRLADLSKDTIAAAAPPGVGFLPLGRALALRSGQPVLVVAQINPQAFTTFQQVLLNSPDMDAALLSYDGQLIAATSGVVRLPGDSLTPLPPFTQFLPRLEQGSWQGKGLRDGPQLAAFRTSASRPLLVVVETSLATVRAQGAAGERGLALAGLVATALLAGMTWLWLRFVRARELARLALKQAQAEVARSERALSITVKSVQELIFRADAEGRLSFVNERWSLISGQGTASAIGTRLADRAPAAERAHVEALFAGDGGNGLRRGAVQLLDMAGTERSFDIAVMPLQQDGRLVGFAGSANDVTARTVAQRALQAQLAFTRQMMDASPLPQSVVDANRRYLLVNRAWEDFTGLRRAKVVGTVVGAYLPLADQALHEARDKELLASGEPQRYESVVEHRDGTLRDVLINKLLLPGEDGRPAGVLSVIVDVTEFRTAERATREARDAAESTLRAKSEFIANISHELRTPLQSIMGFSELGQMRSREQPRLAGMFGDIHGAGQRMLALVNDLLDLAKVESTSGTLHLQRSDLRPLLQAVAREFEPLLLQRGLQLRIQLPPTPLLGRMDAVRLAQVLRNLLANAIKFSPLNGTVEVLAEHTDDDELHVAVADRGPGVPPAELEAIFEPFVQSSQTKDGSGGTGLGLAICRKIVSAHGGHIQAENRRGGGAVFHVNLPAGGTAPTRPAPL